jgi:hypothetical protein
MSWNRWRVRGRPDRDPRLDAPSSWSRRAFLGGAGAAITLPLLPSLLGARGARADSAPPVRAVWWFIPNGVHMPAFRPEAFGPGYVTPRMLAPLDGLQDHLHVLTGLSNLAGVDDRAGDHARGTAAFLTCVTPAHEGVSLGVSVDQVAAAAVGGGTAFPSLQLGYEASISAGQCDSGYACAYSHNISWASPTTPLPKMTDPRSVFDRLFAGFDAAATEEERVRRLGWRLSVLDEVAGDARALQAKLSPSDRHRLDEYLTAVRALEVRLADPSATSCEPPPRPGSGLARTARIDAMSDLTALALACDLTRVATFMLADGLSLASYPDLGAPGAHHGYSHHQGDPSNHEALMRIGTWEMERFAYFLRALAASDGPQGTLLDASLVFLGSEVSDGDRHNHDDMPALLAGHGGGRVGVGQHLDLTGHTYADAYRTMLDALGVAPSAFSVDGDGPLPGV